MIELEAGTNSDKMMILSLDHNLCHVIFALACKRRKKLKKRYVWHSAILNYMACLHNVSQ